MKKEDVNSQEQSRAASLARRFVTAAAEDGASLLELQLACGMAQSAVWDRLRKVKVLASDAEELNA